MVAKETMLTGKICFTCKLRQQNLWNREIFGYRSSDVILPPPSYESVVQTGTLEPPNYTTSLLNQYHMANQCSTHEPLPPSYDDALHVAQHFQLTPLVNHHFISSDCWAIMNRTCFLDTLERFQQYQLSNFADAVGNNHKTFYVLLQVTEEKPDISI